MIFLWNTVSQSSRSAGNRFSIQNQVFLHIFPRILTAILTAIPQSFIPAHPCHGPNCREQRVKWQKCRQAAALVGSGNKRTSGCVFHFPLSSCSVENWSGEKPGPAPAQILEVQTAQDELHTGWELEQTFKLTENWARGQKESLEHQRIVVSV